MEIRFHTLYARNFLSSGQHGIRYNLDQYNTNLIVGENGAGKSLMIDALCFALFNKAFRKVNKPQLVNTINKKDLVVEVEFSVGQTRYKVVRGIKPSVFDIYEGDKLIPSPANPDDYQRILEKDILRVNYKTFCQVVILGAAKFTPFMELPAASRREVVENILDLEFYSAMGSLIKTQIDETKESIQQITQEIAVIEGQKITVENQLNRQDNVDQRLIERIDQQIENIEIELNDQRTKMNNLLATVSALEAEHESIEDMSPKIKETKTMIATADSIVGTNKKLIRILCDNKQCPTCRQEITEEFRAEKVSATQDRVDKYQTAKSTLNERLHLIEGQQMKKLETLEKINKANQQVILIQNVINTTNQTLVALQGTRADNLSATSTNANESKQHLKDLTKKLRSCQSKLKAVRETHALLVFAQSIVRDGGIKSQLIKKYIPRFNKLINEYLTALDFFVSFEINELFEETIKSRYRDEFSYYSFSEGEKVRINLAILFAWRAIAKMRSNANISLLIFDEVFDGSLDVAGTDEFAKLISVISESTNVWIISHATDNIADKFDNVMEIAKQKNFTTIRQL